MPFTVTTLSGENVNRKNPRLRSNESPSGAFKRQSGLRKQMEGLCPDKLRRFSRIANIKIFFPLKMAKAHAEAIQIVFCRDICKNNARVFHLP